MLRVNFLGSNFNFWVCSNWSKLTQSSPNYTPNAMEVEWDNAFIWLGWLGPVILHTQYDMLENAILVVDITIRIPFKVIRKNAHVNHSRQELIFISTSYFRLISIARWSLENCIFGKNDQFKTYILNHFYGHFHVIFFIFESKRENAKYDPTCPRLQFSAISWALELSLEVTDFENLWFKWKIEFKNLEYKKWSSVWRIWDNFVTDFITTLFHWISYGSSKNKGTKIFIAWKYE